MNTGYANPYTVAQAAPNERSAFIRKTYLHLAFAILAFVGLEGFLMQQSWAPALIGKMTGGMGWLVVLAAFMGVSFIAEKLAASGASRGGWGKPFGDPVARDSSHESATEFRVRSTQNPGRAITHAGTSETD